jgi:signal transduction histidine kinase
MATIALNLEFVLSEVGAGMSSELRSALQDCIHSNTRAVAMVADMAEATRLRHGDVRVLGRPVDVCATLSDVLARAGAEASGRRIRIVARLSPMTWSGDVRLLGRALERVVDWTVRHAGAGDEVEVRCRDGAITLEVAAAGLQGVRPSLAMHYAEVVMRAHGGSVSTETDRIGGLLVTITLP